MSATAIIFLAAYCSGVVLALFRHPRYGLYAYLLAFYAHPPGRWWQGDVPDLRWSMMAAAATLIGLMRLPPDRTDTPWLATPIARLFVLYVVWMTIQSLWAITGAWHTEGLVLYAKYALLLFVIYRLVDSADEIRNFLVVNAIGASYLAYLAYVDTGRGRLEGVGGPGIDTSNTLGMHMSTCIALTGALLLLRGSRARLLLLLPLPFMLNAVFQTQSRGAFLGLLAGALVMFWQKPSGRRFLFYSLGALGLAGFLVLAPPVFLNRMATIISLAEEAPQTEETEDGSANVRLALVEAQWQMFKDHPLGAGHRGTTVLSPDYLPEEFLTVDAAKGVEARASHNTLMATLVDQGFVGFGLYVLMLAWIYLTLRRLKRLDRDGLPDNLAIYRMAMAGAVTVIVVAGFFSNYFKAEIMIWVLALMSRLQVLCDAAMVPATEPGAGIAVAGGSRPGTPAHGPPVPPRPRLPAAGRAAGGGRLRG